MEHDEETQPAGQTQPEQHEDNTDTEQVGVRVPQNQPGFEQDGTPSEDATPDPDQDPDAGRVPNLEADVAEGEQEDAADGELPPLDAHAARHLAGTGQRGDPMHHGISN